jgi:U3 small nucleolar RNA-associated protein 4
MKDFAAILQPYTPSHPVSTGSTCIRFTPDSSKLVLTTALSSYVLVIDLTDEKPKVLRRFEHHRIQDLYTSGRILRGKLASSRDQGDGGQPKVNGHALNGDVEMAGVVSPSPSAQPNGICEGEDRNVSSDTDGDVAVVNISRIAISADGQWLATADSRARLLIFNLDSVSVSSSTFFLSSWFTDSLTASHIATYVPKTCPMPHFRPNAPIRATSRLPRQHHSDL